jgi:hypothetical protein
MHMTLAVDYYRSLLLIIYPNLEALATAFPDLGSQFIKK